MQLGHATPELPFRASQNFKWAMTIEFANGSRREAIILSRAGSTMRVVIDGREDVVELTEMSGIWVTDNCEPVRVDFAWKPEPSPFPASESDYICPKDLASKLIRSLQDA